MKIGIFGDSYTQVPDHRIRDKSRNDFSWTEILGKRLNARTSNFALSSTSIYWSYQRFQEKFKEFDTIIFCYSSHLRWYYWKDGFEILSNLGTLGKHVIPNMQNWTTEHKKVANLFLDIHDYIFNEEYQLFVYQQMFNNVNKTCKENNIKVVNILPFETNEPLINLSEASGPCVTSLHVVSAKEIAGTEKNAKLLTYNLLNGKTHDPRFNHMNSVNNFALASVVVDNFDTQNIIDFSKADGLSYDDTLLEYNYELY